MKKNKTNKPLDVFESEKAQAQIVINEATERFLTTINQYRQEHGLDLASVTPEVNEKKRKVTSLCRVYIGSKSNYCGSLMQVMNTLNDAVHAIQREKAQEEMQKQKQEAAKVAEMEKSAEQEQAQNE